MLFAICLLPFLIVVSLIAHDMLTGNNVTDVDVADVDTLLRSLDQPLTERHAA